MSTQLPRLIIKCSYVIADAIHEYLTAQANLTNARASHEQAQADLLQESAREVKEANSSASTNKSKGHKGGMTKHPYGFCPDCGAPGFSRERQGYDLCVNGHKYPSEKATLKPKVLDFTGDDNECE